ncbi:MAG: mechanosensitive ion channel family protein [Actinobacteria bacterium]|nr:mechanosensitive ion channel family protein [Actinomycetota bacterium]MCL5883182.1 mechanosensitive ion channel family protein [Actinomycetota bacterium]
MQSWADRLYDWGTTSGIRIVAIIVGAVVLYFVTRTITRRIMRVAGRKVSDSDLVSREQEMRARTLAGITRGLIIGVMVAVVSLMVLRELGYDIGPLIAGAGIAGIALGFGAQTLVKDIIGGFFILLEGQFYIGDVIKAGTAPGVQGKVEDIKLRTTLLRDGEGILHIIPNGEMRIVSNLTKGWSKVNIDVGVDYREDIEKVEAALGEAAKRTASTPQVRAFISEGPYVLGVEEISGKKVTLRVVARTAPFRDPDVARVLRREIARAMRENDVVMGEGE